MTQTTPTPKPVEFFFDYASPWSYLAWSLLPRQLPDVPITYRPIYLRGFPQFATGYPHPHGIALISMLAFILLAAFFLISEYRSRP
jgi:2-hydroxychromene-2-carboxylate isomerase